MCVEAAPKWRRKKNCGCGGHGRAKTAALNPRMHSRDEIWRGSRTPMQLQRRRALSAPLSGAHRLLLGGFLILHLAVNLLGSVAGPISGGSQSHSSLGALLPVLEIGLIFIPLTIHVASACGPDAPGEIEIRRGETSSRQRHAPMAATRHRRDNAGVYFVSRRRDAPLVRRTVRSARRFQFGVARHLAILARQTGGSFRKLLFAQFYLLGIVAAVYHVTNGVATGAEVLGLVSTPVAQQRLWRICRHHRARCCCSPAWRRGMRLR